MAKSKALVKTDSDSLLTTKVADGSPYQLDPAQVERAATALVTHMKQHAKEKEQEAGKKNLAADEDEAAAKEEPIFLSITTKQHVHDSSRLKPTKLPLPHPIQSNDVRICIFVKDPQRTYKDLIASDAFPATLRAKVGRVIGLDKLQRKFKSFEQKRQLLAQYDVFMVDERVIKSVAECLGKTFYSVKSKRPFPIRLTAGAWIDKKKKKEDKREPQNVVGTPQGVAKEIESALSSTYVSMSASVNTSIRVGLLSQTSQQLKENIEAVVNGLMEKKIVPHGWRNIRTLHIKGLTTKALPIWLADELWVDEKQVLDEPYKFPIKDGQKNKEKKRKWEEWEEELVDEEELAERRARRKEKKAKKEEPAKKALGSISKEKRNKLKKEALSSVQTPLIAG